MTGLDHRRPVLGASAAVWRDGRVLLVKRGHAPWLGHWSLPGGRVEFGETLEQAVRREVAEETGLSIDLPRLVHALDAIERGENGSPLGHFVIIVFTATADGEATAGSDADELGWFTEDEIEALPTTPELARMIKLAAPL